MSVEALRQLGCIRVVGTCAASKPSTRISTEFKHVQVQSSERTHRRTGGTHKHVLHHLNTHVAALRTDHAGARPLMTAGSSTRRCPLTTDNSRQQQVWPAASCADRDRPARCGAQAPAVLNHTTQKTKKVARTHVQEGHKLLYEGVWGDEATLLPQLGSCDGVHDVGGRQLLQVVLHHQGATNL